VGLLLVVQAVQHLRIMVVLESVFFLNHFCKLVVRGAAVTLRVQVLHLLELVVKVA
jgi:hypothetical protein